MLITETVRKNLADLSIGVKKTYGVDWTPAKLVGLNADFIDPHGLTWIDNLETSSGKRLDDADHPDHFKAHVQDYIKKFGVRKCEANGLVVEPEIGCLPGHHVGRTGSGQEHAAGSAVLPDAATGYRHGDHRR